MPKQMTKKQKDAKKHLLANDWGFGLVCFWCLQDFSFEQLTLDHLLPTSKGGTHNLENLRLTCRKCNGSRGNSLFPPPQRYRSSSLVVQKTF
jgi:5-methylcytosine-specific restriction endonuclease McrA